ncbi:MAG TPA: hypothetical protein VH165_12840 [Kofleriaceae bacterium]|jgi:enamine deaminase RidA (YjgF/YER057c/UK114 family)|nr:hypothetical protein [Kofleriaceae bacterium]
MTTFSNPDTVHAPLGLYSHTALVPEGTELVFVSGQIGVRPDDTTPPTISQLVDPAWFIEVEAVAARSKPHIQ